MSVVSFTDQHWQILEALALETLGMDVGILGRGLLRRATELTMAEAEMQDVGSFLQVLTPSSRLLQRWIDAMIVPETWLFRDREAIDWVSHWVKCREERQGMRQGIHQGGQPIRLLSAPCASGEEAYSLAIGLYQAGVRPEDFWVDGIDVSETLIAIAQSGIYGERAWRQEPGGTPTALWQTLVPTPDLASGVGQGRWAAPSSNGSLRSPRYQIHPSIRQRIHFQVENLVQPRSLQVAASYDVIFCRNLLIYLHERARAAVIGLLQRLLKPGGLLVLSRAESYYLVQQNWPTPPDAPPGIFNGLGINGLGVNGLGVNGLGGEAHRPRTPGTIPTQPPRPGAMLCPGPQPCFNPKLLPPQGAPDLIPSSPSPKLSAASNLLPDLSAPASPWTTLLQTAQAAANQGELDQAIRACQQLLEQFPLSAPAYCLLGQIYQAQGWSDLALDNLNRALYLQPHYPDALVLAALLHDAQGRYATAQRLRARMQRLSGVGQGHG